MFSKVGPPINSQPNPPAQPRKLLDRLRDALRLKQYSRRTEKSYCQWVRRFVVFHHLRHPQKMGAAEVAAFLTHLARDRHVAASTQNQAVEWLLIRNDTEGPMKFAAARRACLRRAAGGCCRRGRSTFHRRSVGEIQPEVANCRVRLSFENG
jgi:Phage integrase, N-terminal SAM-like domain